MQATFERWMMSADVASVPLARRRVARVARDQGWGNREVDDVVLMTSELVANAVQHARTPFTVTIDLTGDRLRVEVGDGCTARPVADLAPVEGDVRGRGLLIVAALADRWGVQPCRGGKAVWFESTHDRT